MSWNPHVRIFMQQRGMGNLTLPLPPSLQLPPVPIYFPPSTPTSGTPTPTPTSGGNNPSWWQQLLLGLPSTVAGIWNTHSVTSSPYGINAAFLQHGFYPPNNQGQPPPNSPPDDNAPNPNNGSGVGIGIDGQGIRLSNGDHISWLVIIGALGVVYLIQMQPVRRGR